MLTIILFVFYISFICWVWGIFFWKILEPLFSGLSDYQLPFPFFCLTGMMVLTAIATVVSLFFPIDSLFVHFPLLICSIIIFITKGYNKFIKLEIGRLTSPGPYILLLFAVSILIVLLMGSREIHHPDTLAYHAQIIGWIEKFKAVPGLVHLHNRFGLQSSWFVTSALFSFKFTGSKALTYINYTVLTWYFIFIIGKINFYLHSPQSNVKMSFWILLLLFNCWSFTQLRLTAISASPDFIVTMVTWSIIYLASTTVKKSNKTIQWILLSLLSCYAITIKLSALPLLLFCVAAAVIFILKKEYKSLLFYIIFASIILIPSGIRNVITSGYLAFPIASIDLFENEWKYDKNRCEEISTYVTAYARTEVSGTNNEINRVVQYRLMEWIPFWWRHLSWADQTILILTMISTIGMFFFFKEFLQYSYEIKLLLIISLIGIIFWFLKAPDPRFGFGYFIAPIAYFSNALLKTLLTKQLPKNMLTTIVIVCSLAIASYDLHRLYYYFSPYQLLSPKGIINCKFTPIKCGGIVINIPVQSFPCGSINIPCAYDSCQGYKPRGPDIEDGFMAK